MTKYELKNLIKQCLFESAKGKNKLVTGYKSASKPKAGNNTFKFKSKSKLKEDDEMGSDVDGESDTDDNVTVTMPSSVAKQLQSLLSAVLDSDKQSTPSGDEEEETADEGDE